MSNATQEQQKTAVELFKSGDETMIRSLHLKLNRFLNGKPDYPRFHSHVQHLTFQEFQDKFDWDESYSVVTSWETEILNSYKSTHQCSSKEEALSYVRGETDLEEPDLSDYYPEYELTGAYNCSLEVEVQNLRLKEQWTPKKKSWKVSFDILANENFDMSQFTAGISSLVNKEKLEVIDSQFSEIESLTPDGGEVVGQK